MPLGIGPLHPTRIDTHWWLPLQFCVLILKMDMNRVRNMYSDNKPIETKAASRWLFTYTILAVFGVTEGREKLNEEFY